MRQHVQHAGQVMAGVGGLGPDGLEGQLLAVHPQGGEAKPRGAQGVPAVAGDKQNFFYLHRDGVLHQTVGFGRCFEQTKGIHRNDVVNQLAHTCVGDRRVEHLGATVGEDRGGDATFLQALQHAQVLWERRELGVLTHQGGDVVGLGVELETRQRVVEGEPCQFPKRLVVATAFGSVRVRHGDEPRVVNLLVAPQHRDGCALARIQLLSQCPDGIHIEQRAIGIEHNGFDGHGVSLRGA